MVLYQAGGSAATSAAIGHANLTDLLGGGGVEGITGGRERGNRGEVRGGSDQFPPQCIDSFYGPVNIQRLSGCHRRISPHFPQITPAAARQ